LLAQLQKKMSELVAQSDAVEHLKGELEAEHRATEAKQQKLDQERARLGGSYREELERLRDDVTRQVSAEIRNLRELDRAGRASLNASQVVGTLTRSVEKAIEFMPAEQREVRVGDRAEHRKFKVSGDVVSIDGKKAVLSVGGKRMTVDVRDLSSQIAVGSSQKGKPRPAARGPRSATDVEEISAELNLIGQRVDDALEESDKFLDRALLEGKQAVRIIHGFGTGALRKAIREHLRKHPAVKSWRPGNENEGGDGATVAVLEG
jgi:DNA mismatch repair protein MutS2